MEMGLLEVKHGLLQVSESLDFLHNNAHLIHRAISPELVKQAILPRVHGLALKTTVAADILRKIEEKQGVTGVPEVKVSPPLANGLHSEPIHKPSLPISSSKTSPAWDEDWGPISRGTSATSSLDPNQQVKQPITASHPALVSVTHMAFSTSTVNQQTSSRTSEDIQWPPPITSTAFTTQLRVDEKKNQNTGAHPGNSFDDLDTFANWPLRPSNSASSNTGFPTKSTNNKGTSGPNMSSLGFIDNSNPIGLAKPQQRTSSSNTSIGNSKSLLGIGNSNSLLGMGYSNASSNGNRTGDLRPVFASANSGQPTPLIAPPPTSTTGRERGRNLGHAGLAQASRSEQPPILDLL